jgi:hypothetical protein
MFVIFFRVAPPPFRSIGANLKAKIASNRRAEPAHACTSPPNVQPPVGASAPNRRTVDLAR